MVARGLSRRGLLGAMAAAAACPSVLAAGDVVDLEWDDLMPEGPASVAETFLGLLEHDEWGPPAQQPVSTGVLTDWNGMVVRLPGFVIPLEYRGTGVSAFILAPFVGACIHVPPPPANQLVYVTTERPYQSSGLFEPVRVTGELGTAPTATELAEIGYTLRAESIEPYS